MTWWDNRGGGKVINGKEGAEWEFELLERFVVQVIALLQFCLFKTLFVDIQTQGMDLYT